MEAIRIKTHLLTLGCLVLLTIQTGAQELLFEKRTDTTHQTHLIGPNRLHFIHPVLSLGFAPPMANTQTYPIMSALPVDLTIGCRYKLKVQKHFALVTNLGITRSVFRLKTGSSPDLFNSQEFSSSTLRLTSLSGGLFMRIRLGQAGNYLGNYVDIGVTGQVPLLGMMTSVTSLSITDPGGWTIDKTTRARFRGIRSISSQAMVRVGFDRIAVILSYPLSPILENSFAKDLPGIRIGIEVSPIRY